MDIDLFIDPPQLYRVYLERTGQWVFMEECAGCFAIILSNRPELCHHCPDISPALWKDNASELREILSQATIFEKVERVAMCA